MSDEEFKASMSLVDNNIHRAFVDVGRYVVLNVIIMIAFINSGILTDDWVMIAQLVNTGLYTLLRMRFNSLADKHPISDTDLENITEGESGGTTNSDTNSDLTAEANSEE